MTQQRLHSQLAPIDLLTRDEMQAVMDHSLDAVVRDRYRGLEIQRFPIVSVTASAATVNLATGNDQTPCGPEQGDVWMPRRVIVTSMNLTDTARYILFRGSTPSDPSSYTGRYLLEGFALGTTAPIPSQPAVPATGVAQQNVNNYPVQVVISPNGATITNVSVNGISVGTAAGTYTVPAYGSISISYSVATPTWVWSNTNTATPQGQPVNLGWYPSNKAIYLQPGEQIYAQVLGATVGAQYLLNGDAIRVPAEMKGKVL